MKTATLCLLLMSISGCASVPSNRPGATADQLAADRAQCEKTVDASPLSVPGKNPVATKVNDSRRRGEALDACMRDKGYR
jgi:hypothetical protein